jgi:hypothetical protein
MSIRKRQLNTEELLDLLSYGRKRENLDTYRRSSCFEDKRRKGKGNRRQQRQKAIDG